MFNSAHNQTLQEKLLKAAEDDTCGHRRQATSCLWKSSGPARISSKISLRSRISCRFVISDGSMAPTCRTRRTKGAVTSSRRHHGGSSSPHGAALPPGMNSIPEQRVSNECSARVKAVLASPLPCDSRRRAPCCRRVHPPADSAVRPGPVELRSTRRSRWAAAARLCGSRCRRSVRSRRAHSAEARS